MKRWTVLVLILGISAMGGCIKKTFPVTGCSAQ